jgi:hypothetical protein
MCPKVASQDECLKLLYFQDKFTCTGKDKLKFTQIAEGTTSTNCIATCCNTCVLVDNFFYHQGSGDVGSTDGSGVVMMFEQHTPTGIESEPAIRWWVKDLPEEKLAAMPPLPGFRESARARACACSSLPLCLAPIPRRAARAGAKLSGS